MIQVRKGEDCCGWLNAEQRGLYTVFWGQVQTEELCRVYAIFEGGELALGIPVPEGEHMVIRSSLPTSGLPKGTLLYGELRPKDSLWHTFPGGRVGPADLPCGQVNGQRYRFPWSPDQPLPYAPYLCFFRYVQEGEQGYLELSLDGQNMPCTKEDQNKPS